jgi:hypothetical protein
MAEEIEEFDPDNGVELFTAYILERKKDSFVWDFESRAFVAKVCAESLIPSERLALALLAMQTDKGIRVNFATAYFNPATQGIEFES